MITEDYVSFETAKLLKEKGFCNIGTMLYKENGDIVRYNVPLNNKGFSSTLGVFYEAPTLQMAMKWFREVYKLSIEPYYDLVLSYVVDVKHIGKHTDTKEFEEVRSQSYNSYEEAAEAAIKYCLEKLI